jgi:hypothetical protein
MEGAVLDGAFELDDAFDESENIDGETDGVALTFRSARLSSCMAAKRPLFM